MALEYGRFLRELREAKKLTNEQIAQMIEEKFGQPTRAGQVADFLRSQSEPRAGFAKAVESVLGVDLDPTYYGFGSNKKPNAQGDER